MFVMLVLVVVVYDREWMEFHKVRNSDRSNDIVSFSLSLSSSLVVVVVAEDDDEDDDELIRVRRGKPCPDSCSCVETPAWLSSTTARVVVEIVLVFPGPSTNRRRFLIGREINFGVFLSFGAARFAVFEAVATLVLM